MRRRTSGDVSSPSSRSVIRRTASPGLLRFIGENILMMLLVLATNPIAFRAAVLRRDHTRVVISRAKLLRLYRATRA
jgi:hypothetical protein